MSPPPTSLQGQPSVWTAEGSQKVDGKSQHDTLRETEIGLPDAMGWAGEEGARRES